jgi:hypothetical protein
MLGVLIVAILHTTSTQPIMFVRLVIPNSMLVLPVSKMEVSALSVSMGTWELTTQCQVS